MKIEKARIDAKGIDCDTPLDLYSCAKLKAAGIEFVVRYVRDVKPTELECIFDSGLAFMGAAHVRYGGWLPSYGMGLLDGINLANATRALQLPSDMTLWCDLEGVGDAATVDTVTGYVNAWADSISNAGYEPGLYVGFKSVLTDWQLYHYLKLRRYWKSGSSVPTPVERGFCMIQQTPLDVMFEGIKVDHDVIQADGFGDVPTWVVA